MSTKVGFGFGSWDYSVFDAYLSTVEATQELPALQALSALDPEQVRIAVFCSARSPKARPSAVLHIVPFRIVLPVPRLGVLLSHPSMPECRIRKI